MFIGTELAFVDILILLLITVLDFLFYYYKKRSKEVKILKYSIPTILIGLVILLAVKDTVQDYFFLISIGMLSIFYIYVLQANYKPFKRKSKGIKYNITSESEHDFDFKTEIEQEDIEVSKSDSDEFDQLIERIYDRDTK